MKSSRVGVQDAVGSEWIPPGQMEGPASRAQRELDSPQTRLAAGRMI